MIRASRIEGTVSASWFGRTCNLVSRRRPFTFYGDVSLLRGARPGLGLLHYRQGGEKWHFLPETSLMFRATKESELSF